MKVGAKVAVDKTTKKKTFKKDIPKTLKKHDYMEMTRKRIMYCNNGVVHK